MNNENLTATGSRGGTQSSTQSPQSSSGSSSFASGQQGSSVQPGTPTAVLNSQSGVPLHNTQLSTVSLNTSTATGSTNTPTATTHHANWGLTALSILLLVVAIILFYVASRPVKNTSEQ